jgi:hypothetical protein
MRMTQRRSSRTRYNIGLQADTRADLNIDRSLGGQKMAGAKRPGLKPNASRLGGFGLLENCRQEIHPDPALGHHADQAIDVLPIKAKQVAQL